MSKAFAKEHGLKHEGSARYGKAEYSHMEHGEPETGPGGNLVSANSGQKKWIQGAIKHPGALHRQLGVPEGEKIPAGKLESAAKAGGTLGKRARLAKTLKGLKK